MKLLLDENIPLDFRIPLGEHHEVLTVEFMKWKSMRNGELLSAAAAAGFDAMVTFDRGIEYEQNLLKLPLAILLIVDRRLEKEQVLLQPIYEAILSNTIKLTRSEFKKVVLI